MKNPADPVILKMSEGELEGFSFTTKNGTKTQVFLGVPFAHANRFEKPKAYPRWTGIRQAKDFPLGCVPVNANYGSQVSEDCLYLNIIRPEKQSRGKGYPVLVFIHGGGFVGGDASKYGFKSFAEHFVSHGILVISVQYRIGFLGFLSTGDKILPGNLGLWDLAFAIRLIKEQVQSFGGNPDEITLFGHSAGSAAVHALSISPVTQGLFKRAIQSSASLFSEWAFNKQVVQNSFALIEALGCDRKMSSEEILEKLSAKTITEMSDAALKVAKSLKPTLREFMFNPRFDGEFFPEPIDELTKKAPKLPVLFGLTEIEWANIVNLPQGDFNTIGLTSEARSDFSSEQFTNYINKIVLENSKEPEIEKLKDALVDFFVTGNAQKNLRNVVDLVSDLMFVLPVIQQILLRNQVEQKSYLFYEKHVHEQYGIVPGAPHSNELLYLFDNERGSFDFNEKDRQFQSHLCQGFVNFVKSGKPSSDGKEWSDTGNGTRHVVLNPSPVVEPEFEEKRMKFWLEKLPSMVERETLKKTRLPFLQ
uniref:Carboxylic ester hydrolase n=1 Tax=Panagrolaimus sp. JU765 TaxID=591449 RepID=A0AC34QMK5_9BILA